MFSVFAYLDTREPRVHFREHVFLDHASFHPRPGYDLSKYSDFILLHYYSTFTGPRVRTCIIIVLFSSIGPLVRDCLVLWFMHHVTGPRARCGIPWSLCTMTPGQESRGTLLQYCHVWSWIPCSVAHVDPWLLYHHVHVLPVFMLWIIWGQLCSALSCQCDGLLFCLVNATDLCFVLSMRQTFVLSCQYDRFMPCYPR